MLIQIKPNITEWQQKAIARIWRHVTKVVKDALVASGGPARSSYTFEGLAYSHVDVHVEDGEDNGYTVRQVLIEIHTGTDDADALIVHIRPEANGQTGMLQRTWLHRSTAAKTVLIAATGKARLDYTWIAPGDGLLYTHIDCTIQDHEDGAYTVSQTLANLNSGSVDVYFTHERREVQTETHDKDDKKRYFVYTYRVKISGTEKGGWDDIKSVEDMSSSPHVVVAAGTGHVTKVSPTQWRAMCKYWEPDHVITVAAWNAGLADGVTGITEWI
jgi:hypothetical protein